MEVFMLGGSAVIGQESRGKCPTLYICRLRDHARQNRGVIDPFAVDCVVVTGSRTPGNQASHNDDNNLVLIDGNKKRVMAYATHTLVVYSHFARRWTLKNRTSTDDPCPKSRTDQWLEWYYGT